MSDVEPVPPVVDVPPVVPEVPVVEAPPVVAETPVVPEVPVVEAPPPAPEKPALQDMDWDGTDIKALATVLPPKLFASIERAFTTLDGKANDLQRWETLLNTDVKAVEDKYKGDLDKYKTENEKYKADLQKYQDFEEQTWVEKFDSFMQTNYPDIYKDDKAFGVLQAKLEAGYKFNDAVVLAKAALPVVAPPPPPKPPVVVPAAARGLTKPAAAPPKRGVNQNQDPWAVAEELKKGL